jgi:hypothetical protein
MMSKALSTSIDPPDYPTGKSKRASNKSKSSPSRRNILIFRNRKSLVYSCRPVPLEGRFAIVTDAGWDAVDANAPITNGAEADGEVVWS